MYANLSSQKKLITSTANVLEKKSQKSLRKKRIQTKNRRLFGDDLFWISLYVLLIPATNFLIVWMSYFQSESFNGGKEARVN